MADDDQPLQLINHADPDSAFPMLDNSATSASSSFAQPQQPSSNGLQSPKLETSDEFRLLPPGTPAAPAQPKFNFRKQKRHRVMQSCVACHTQKRKCDRKRPCTRCVEHGISGMCVYQLEDPSQRDGPDQEELWRLRNRVAELERTVRVLMQKPLSRRAAAALEAETDALLGTTSTRKRKIDKEKETDDERARKAVKSDHDVDGGGITPGWAAYADTSFPSPADSVFSPYGPTPSDSNWSQYNPYNLGADDVPTPPYSTFPTPSTDAGSPFKVPMDPVERRFSTGSSLANMLSQTAMMSQTPESMTGQSPVSPISTSGVPFSPIANAAPPGKCGCGVNPIGNEVLSGLQQSLEAAYDVINTLPDHQVGGQCVLVIGMASLLEAIHVHTQQNTAAAVSASPPMSSPPTPSMGHQMQMPMQPPTLNIPSSAYMTPAPSNHMTPASSSHMSPLTHMSPAIPDQGPSPHSSLAGPSPHSSIASPANYHLYSGNNNNQGFYHSDIPTVSGFTSLSSWASFTGSAAPLLNNSCDNSLSNFDGHHHGNHNLGYMQHSNNSSLAVYDQQHP
ncbi:hypothetical protein FRB94_002136 [Tulasnella sp. JGI-2019a]|nr:hypothetical protein FRB93_009097 [Tulasnella sp. JGI-2019a]KAG9013542.1 hypothetical protein FRB94_002136 [Tulasnella sp. JGI-2019a]KAG9037192.1 hypothetical protein FRB95_006445 [Tulasnella sp. JGI-2019a]